MTGKVKIMLYCSKLEKVVKEEGEGALFCGLIVVVTLFKSNLVLNGCLSN